MSMENPDVRECRCPAVIISWRVAPTPIPAKHRIDDSDSHKVDSQPENPCRTADEKAKVEKRPPNKDTYAFPSAIDPPRLDPEPKYAASIENPILLVLKHFPAVTTERRLCWIPRANLHLIDVSESQSVASHPVCPTRPIAVNNTNPIPAPCTVTIADPVPARLARCTVLKVTALKDNSSIMYAWVRLAVRLPTVIAAALAVPFRPDAAWHTIEVVDVHAENSAAVHELRTAAEDPDRPRLLPITVRLTDPVDPKFIGQLPKGQLPMMLSSLKGLTKHRYRQPAYTGRS